MRELDTQATARDLRAVGADREVCIDHVELRSEVTHGRPLPGHFFGCDVDCETQISQPRRHQRGIAECSGRQVGTCCPAEREA